MARTRILGRGTTAVRWNGDFVGQRMEEIAIEVMGSMMLDARIAATNRLWPGSGVDTGTMKARTHVAPGGYNWIAENIKPSVGTAAIGDDLVPSVIRGKYALEVGVGQKYAIFYHQKRDPFIRVAVDRVMRGFKKEVQQRWRASFQ